MSTLIARASRTVSSLVSRRWRSTAVLCLALSTVAACADATGPDGASGGDKTPKTTVPSELVGTWLNGSVSPTNFYNPSTGSWSNGYGTGLFYRFNTDGTFEYGWQTYSTLYSCSERATVYRKGTVTVDAASHTIQLYTTSSVVHGESTCSSTPSYTKPGPTDQETLIWDWDKDEYGHTYLMLRWPTTTYSAFHQE
jgi:hypothetical protein